MYTILQGTSIINQTDTFMEGIETILQYIRNELDQNIDKEMIYWKRNLNGIWVINVNNPYSLNHIYKILKM